MGLLSRFKASPTPVATEHTVIARYVLTAGPTGTSTDIHDVATLEDRIVDAISAARVGEFEGSQFGTGEVTLLIYGPDADRLFAVVEPILRSFAPRPAQIVVRYGSFEDTRAPETVIHL